MRDPKAARWNELLAEERRISAQVKWPKNVFGNEDIDDLKTFCMTFLDSADALKDDEASTLVALA